MNGDSAPWRREWLRRDSHRRQTISIVRRHRSDCLGAMRDQPRPGGTSASWTIADHTRVALVDELTDDPP
jgi:hypothetical protein